MNKKLSEMTPREKVQEDHKQMWSEQTPEYQRVREEVAIQLIVRDELVTFDEAVEVWEGAKTASIKGHFGDCTKEPQPCSLCFVERQLKEADQILSIPGIAILAEDQSLPINSEIPTEFNEDACGAEDDTDNVAREYYLLAQQDMLK